MSVSLLYLIPAIISHIWPAVFPFHEQPSTAKDWQDAYSIQELQLSAEELKLKNHNSIFKFMNIH
ncbi:hypothetical protein HK096_011607, partial [Nowakowskiella sp. JEL0078]